MKQEVLIMTAFSTRVWTFAAVFIYAGAQECPTDWIGFENSCYMFIDEFVPWTSAKVFCDLLGGNMLEVETQAENDFIAAEIRNNSGIQAAWQGLNDLVREGRWVWNSNGEVPEFFNWAPGMPDNNHAHENGEDCVEIKPDGTWNDLWCEDFLNGARYKPSPVCEISIEGEEVIG